MEITAPGRTVMTIPAACDTLRLVSASGRQPADRRRLGVLVRALRVDGMTLPITDPRLGIGFYAPERHGTQTLRWTNGDAIITLGAAEDMRLIELDVAAVVEGERIRLVA
jgi:hypothetical protein